MSSGPIGADASPFAPLAPVSFGPYLLIGRAGRGGMAEVLLAVRRGLCGFERLVALKRLLPSLRRDERFVSMLLDEARLGGLIRHPSIIPVTDVGAVDGEHYLALELVEGMTLDRLRVRSGDIPVGVAAMIAHSLFDALAHLHEARDHHGTSLSVVHGDVSPSNVIVGWDGGTRLLDLGIAEWRGRGSAAPRGGLRGKPGYLAPELIHGAGADQRADIFAAGVVVWELISGARLFGRGDPTSRLMATMEQPIAPPSTLRPCVPAVLDDLCMATLARHPSARPASAREVATVLQRHLSQRALPGELHVAAWLAAAHGDARAEDQSAIERALEALAPESGRTVPVGTPDAGRAPHTLPDARNAPTTRPVRARATRRVEDALALDSDAPASTRRRARRRRSVVPLASTAG